MAEYRREQQTETRQQNLGASQKHLESRHDTLDKTHTLLANVVDGPDAQRKSAKDRSIKDVKKLPKARTGGTGETMSVDDAYNQQMAKYKAEMAARAEMLGTSQPETAAKIEKKESPDDVGHRTEVEQLDESELPEFDWGVKHGQFRRNKKDGEMKVKGVSRRKDGQIEFELAEKEEEINPVDAELEHVMQMGPTTPFDIFAAYIGVDTTRNPQLLWIAEEAFSAPMAPEWRTLQLPNGHPMYFNVDTGVMTCESPPAAFYRALVDGVKDKAATQIQKLIRMKLAKKRVKAMRVNKNAVLTIQLCYRVWKAKKEFSRRMKYKDVLDARRKQHDAAVAIQIRIRYALWRIARAREAERKRQEALKAQRMHHEIDAVKKIEKWFLNWKSTQEAKDAARRRAEAIRRIQRACKNFLYKKSLETKVKTLEGTLGDLEAFLKQEQIASRKHENRLKEQLKEAGRQNQQILAKLDVARAVADEFARANGQLVASYNNQRTQAERAKAVSKERLGLLDKLSLPAWRESVPRVDVHKPTGDEFDGDDIVAEPIVPEGHRLHKDYQALMARDSSPTALGATAPAGFGKKSPGRPSSKGSHRETSPSRHRPATEPSSSPQKLSNTHAEGMDIDAEMEAAAENQRRLNEHKAQQKKRSKVDKMDMRAPGSPANNSPNRVPMFEASPNNVEDKVRTPSASTAAAVTRENLDGRVYRDWLSIIRDVELVADSNVRNNLDRHGNALKRRLTEDELLEELKAPNVMAAGGRQSRINSRVGSSRSSRSSRASSASSRKSSAKGQRSYHDVTSEDFSSFYDQENRQNSSNRKLRFSEDVGGKKAKRPNGKLPALSR